MTKRISLYKVFNELEALDDQGQLEDFKNRALHLISELDSVSTHTTASAVTELFWYWMQEHELPVYDFGEPVDDVTNVAFYIDENDARFSVQEQYKTAERAFLEGWKFDCDELKEKLQDEGFQVPGFLMNTNSTPQAAEAEYNESDASLGRAYRERLQSFANRNNEISEDRQEQWASWKAEGERIQKGRQNKLSKLQLASRIKEALKLPDKIGTIRKRI